MIKSQGFFRNEMAGLPRFDSADMGSEYPFVNFKFTDDQMPVQVSLEAFTPFIPLNADDSGIPGAYLQYKVKNPGREKVEVSIAGSMNNAVGFEGYNNFSFMQHAGERVTDTVMIAESEGLHIREGAFPTSILPGIWLLRPQRPQKI